MSTSGQCPIMSLGSRPRPLMEASLLGNLGSFSSGSMEARSCTSGDRENASNFTLTLRHCCKTIHVLTIHKKMFYPVIKLEKTKQINFSQQKMLQTLVYEVEGRSRDTLHKFRNSFVFLLIYLEICWEIWLLNKVTFSLFPFSTSTVHY